MWELYVQEIIDMRKEEAMARGEEMSPHMITQQPGIVQYAKKTERNSLYIYGITCETNKIKMNKERVS